MDSVIRDLFYGELDFSSDGFIQDPYYQEAMEKSHTLEAALLESLIPSLGYMEETSILVQVQPDEDGYYYLSEDDFANLDWLVVYYDSLGT